MSDCSERVVLVKGFDWLAFTILHILAQSHLAMERPPSGTPEPEPMEAESPRSAMTMPKSLPPGWKREVVVRKNGLSAGKSDVYYYR